MPAQPKEPYIRHNALFLRAKVFDELILLERARIVCTSAAQSPGRNEMSPVDSPEEDARGRLWNYFTGTPRRSCFGRGPGSRAPQRQDARPRWQPLRHPG